MLLGQLHSFRDSLESEQLQWKPHGCHGSLKVGEGGGGKGRGGREGEGRERGRRGEERRRRKEKRKGEEGGGQGKGGECDNGRTWIWLVEALSLDLIFYEFLSRSQQLLFQLYCLYIHRRRGGGETEDGKGRGRKGGEGRIEKGVCTNEENTGGRQGKSFSCPHSQKWNPWNKVREAK